MEEYGKKHDISVILVVVSIIATIICVIADDDRWHHWDTMALASLWASAIIWSCWAFKGDFKHAREQKGKENKMDKSIKTVTRKKVVEFHSATDTHLVIVTDYAFWKHIGATEVVKIEDGAELPLNVVSINRVIAMAEEYGYEVDDKIRKLRDTIEEDIIVDRTLREFHDTHDERLRPYQNMGVELVKDKGSFGLLWQQRTGKTPASVIAVKEYKKVIIIVPAGLELVWRREVIKWSGREDVEVLKATPKQREKQYARLNAQDSFMLIGSHDTLTKDIPLKAYKKNGKDVEATKGLWKPKDIDFMVVDEAHVVRSLSKGSGASTKSRAILQLRSYAKNCLVLTGTPVDRHDKEMIPLLNLITNGAYDRYKMENYFFETGKDFMGYRFVGNLKVDKEDEWTQLLYKHTHRLFRHEVNKWLPKIVKNEILIQLTPAQQRLHKKIMTEMRYEKEDDSIHRDYGTLTMMGTLSMLGLDQRLINAKEKGKSGKTEWFRNYFKENSDKPVIVVSNYTSYLNLLNDELFGGSAPMITGEHSTKQKTEAARLFQEGESNILLVNIKAGGTGWTLDRAETMIFTEKSYSPMENNQIASRIEDVKEENVNGDKEIIYLRNFNAEEMSSAGDSIKGTMDDFRNDINEKKIEDTEISNHFAKWVERKGK